MPKIVKLWAKCRTCGAEFVSPAQITGELSTARTNTLSASVNCPNGHLTLVTNSTAIAELEDGTKVPFSPSH